MAFEQDLIYTYAPLRPETLIIATQDQSFGHSVYCDTYANTKHDTCVSREHKIILKGIG